MRQQNQKLPPPPPGYEDSELIDPGAVQFSPRGQSLPASAVSLSDPLMPTPPVGVDRPGFVGPPVLDPEQAKFDKYANQDTVDLMPQYLRTFASESLAPYSALNANGSPQVPPAISGMASMFSPQSFLEHIMGRGAASISQGLQSMYDSLRNTGSEDPLTRAEGYGQIASPFVIPAAQASRIGGFASRAASGLESMAGRMRPAPTPPPQGGQFMTQGTPTATSGRFTTGTQVKPPAPRQIGTGPIPLSSSTAPIEAEFVDPVAAHPRSPNARIVSSEPVRPPSAPQIGAAPSQLQLPPGQGGFIPGGGTMPIQPEGPLPAHYSKMPAETQPSQPGTFGIRRNMQGQEGGIPPRGEQTVTPTRVPHIAVNDSITGKFRRMTSGELQSFIDKMISERSTAGRTARSNEPAPPPKPTPKKGKK